MAIQAAVSALTIWITAAQTGCPLDLKTANDLQNAAAAIDDWMGQAEAACIALNIEQNFFFARHLIRMIDRSLWNFQGDNVDEAPFICDFVATADIALTRLTLLSMALSTITGSSK